MTPIERDEPRVPLDRVRTRLAALWFLGAGFSFAILFVQTLLNRFGNTVKDVWSWYIPNTVPTLSLIITVLGAAAMGAEREGRSVRRAFYDLAWWLSIAYLAFLAATLILQPLSGLRPIDLYSMANFGLGPLQGLVVAAIGYIFVSEDNNQIQRIQRKSTK
jgi:hypothetical protein